MERPNELRPKRKGPCIVYAAAGVCAALLIGCAATAGSYRPEAEIPADDIAYEIPATPEQALVTPDPALETPEPSFEPTPTPSPIPDLNNYRVDDDENSVPLPEEPVAFTKKLKNGSSGKLVKQLQQRIVVVKPQILVHRRAYRRALDRLLYPV